ncbi:MAG: hypothetical protein QOJ07_528 [Thermoleophilaceae bacterium]|nr:hypothetical protein [Thermoleophilaceae bacterium]
MDETTRAARTTAVDDGVTRRRLLQAGGAAAAFAFVYSSPLASGLARAAGNDPTYLQRSGWVDLVGTEFPVVGGTLKLEAVADLPSAATNPVLRGAEDAFALEFSGPPSLVSGVQRLSLPQFGTFDLFVGPVGPGGGATPMEGVINRVLSNSEARRTPPKPPRRSPTVVSEPPKPAHVKHPHPVSKVAAHRTKRGVKCVVTLEHGADVHALVAWLRRGDRVVAASSHKVKGSRVAFVLKTGNRPRKGRYEIDVLTTDGVGESAVKQVQITVR